MEEVKKEVQGEGVEVKTVTEVAAEVKAPAAVEPAKEEVKKEDSAAVEELEKLKAALLENEAKAKQLETEVKGLADTKKQLEETTAKASVYENMISTIVETKINEVPEEFRELIPGNLSLVEKLSWLEKAEAKNLFKKEAPAAAAAVEIGKPINVEVPKADTSRLSASEIFSMAYSKLKK